jgi:head-tail adaptor
MPERIAPQNATETRNDTGLSDEQLIQVWTNVAPSHPALRRVHQKLNTSSGAEAAITSYDRMHHRHNRS